jgi:hypothetical protein
MKRLSRNEARGGGVSGKTQFEGRTAEEAVARARKALGDSDALRCWKTRKGGVGGFFAREVYVASLTPPPGSEATRGKGSRTSSRRTTDGSARSVSDGSARSVGAGAASPALPHGTGDPQDHLSGLVEATNDQLSLQSLAIPAGAFDQVLAEAEAALARLPEVGDTEAADHPGVPPEVEDAEAELEHDVSPGPPEGARPLDRAEPGPPQTAGTVDATTAKAKAAARPKPRARPKAPASRPVAPVTPAPRTRAPRLPDLKPGLRSLGVPNAYLPPGRRPSLDLLADVMATLPVPGALPTGAGAVVAVVGGRSDLDRTVDLVMSKLSLGQRDVVQLGQGPGTGSQIVRRRANGRRSVVAVHAEPGRPLAQQTQECLEHLVPDYVLAAVSAQSKRADVEHWAGELPNVDALALWDLAGTRTPAELLGVLPIAFVDGAAGSPLGWTLFLAGRAVGWPR